MDPLIDPPRSVTRAVALGCDRDRAWSLIATAEGWARWLGSDVRLDPEVGGAIGLRDDDGAARVGRVVAAEHGRSLTFEWSPVGDAATRSTITLTLDDDEDGASRLTVVERPGGGGRASWLDAGAAWDARLVALEVDVALAGPLAGVTAPAL